jgi:hypothetical protein
MHNSSWYIQKYRKRYRYLCDMQVYTLTVKLTFLYIYFYQVMCTYWQEKPAKHQFFFTEARWWLHCTYYKQLDRLHIPIFYWLFLNTQLSTLYTSQTTISCMICYTELKLPGLLFIKRGDTTILEECCCYAPHHSCNFLHDILQFKKLTKQKQSVTNFILKRINKIINNFNTPLNNPKCESTRRIPWKKETFSCPLEIRRLHS